MRTTSFDKTVRLAIGAALLAALAGCNRPAQPVETPAPAVPPPEAAPAALAPAATAVPIAAPAAPKAPPAAAHGPGKSEPAVAAMKLAVASQKRGVPVDLHYQFDDEVKAGRPVTLHLAAVPRVEGSNLVVSIKEDPGILATASPLSAQKASAATAYRQQLPVTKLGNAATELRVLVTMDTPEGPAFSWFGVPLGEAPAAAKQEAVKQR